EGPDPPAKMCVPVCSYQIRRDFMATNSAQPATDSGPDLSCEREVRFAVVMYGGVSLAIYINGVAQELWRLVRSTASNGVTPTNTERVYRKLNYLLADRDRDLEKA